MGIKSRAVYEWVNISDDLVYEWVHFKARYMNGVGFKILDRTPISGICSAFANSVDPKLASN